MRPKKATNITHRHREVQCQPEGKGGGGGGQGVVGEGEGDGQRLCGDSGCRMPGVDDVLLHCAL